MLIKVIGYKRPGYERLLNYMIGHEDRLFDTNGRSFVLTQNFNGRSIPKWVAQLQAADKQRPRHRKNANYMTQEILTFRKENAPDLSIEKLSHITKKYMQMRSPRAQYIAIPHFDRGHYHVHILVSAFEYGTGKSMRMTKRQFESLKKGMQEYVIKQYPELQQSAVQHGRKRGGKIKELEYQHKRRTGKKSMQENVRDIVAKYYVDAESESHFHEMLHKNGITTYVRGGVVYGVIYKEKKYRFRTLGINAGSDFLRGRTMRLQQTRVAQSLIKMKRHKGR